MERAPQEEPFDESFSFDFRRLYEDGLRLLGALGKAPAFPNDVAGVERLIGNVAEDEPDERIRIAVEAPGVLPRYSGEHLLWVCPRGDGTLHLRAEEYGLGAVAATLAPDGSLSGFERQQGFGVPDPELTAQARADRDRVEQRMHEDEAAAVESRRRVEEQQGRFRTTGLRGVGAAPWQDPAGLVIAWVAFYESGFIVSHLLSRGAGDGQEGPGLTVVDDLGNAYEEVGIGRTTADLALHRVAREFVPGVAAGASRLIIRSDWGTVDVEVAP
ncbi:MAG TPA: hypothetical protein VH299_07550 [Solirubrobacterales bacterium]|jgi:hypothetical protein|nr:hypothetical protein [Solirubrobacterales bacterium]